MFQALNTIKIWRKKINRLCLLYIFIIMPSVLYPPKPQKQKHLEYFCKGTFPSPIFCRFWSVLLAAFGCLVVIVVLLYAVLLWSASSPNKMGRSRSPLYYFCYYYYYSLTDQRPSHLEECAVQHPIPHFLRPYAQSKHCCRNITMAPFFPQVQNLHDEISI